jgi:hypothetical protein
MRRDSIRWGALLKAERLVRQLGEKLPELGFVSRPRLGFASKPPLDRGRGSLKLDREQLRVPRVSVKNGLKDLIY